MSRLCCQWRRSGLLSGVLLLTTSLALAAEAVEVTPFAGYRLGGQFKDDTSAKLKLNDHNNLALAFNWRASEPGSQYELFYSRQSTRTQSTTSPLPFKVEYLTIGGTTPLGELDARVVPFAVGGIGAARLTPGVGGNQETRWSLNLGGGIRVPVAKHVRLRLEARGHVTWLGDNANLYCTGGCTAAAKSKTFFQYEALAGVSVSF